MTSSQESPSPPVGPEVEHVLDSRRAGRRFLRGGGLRLLSFAAGILVGLGATPLVVHHLGATRWGDYGKVSSLLFIVAALTEGGLGQMGLRELSVGNPEAHRGFMRDLLGLRIFLTTLGVAAAVVFAWAAGWDSVVVAGVAIAGLGSVCSNIQGALALPLGASLRLGWLALIDFVPQLTGALLMVALVLAAAGLEPFYCVPLVAGVSGMGLTVALVRGHTSLFPALRPRRWRELLAQTFVYAVATATGAAYFRIALVATSLLSSPHQTGYFALAFRVLELTASVPWLLLGSAFPILVRSAWNDSDRLRYALQRLCEGALIVGGWFAFCLVIGAPFAIHVLEGGGHAFAPSVPALRILGGAIAATFFLATFSYTLLSLQMYRQLVSVNAGIVALSVALSFVLIPGGGARGAAWLSLILEAVMCAAYAVVLFRARPDLRPSPAGAERVLLALAASFALGVVLDRHPVVAVLSGTALFGGALLALRAVPLELLDAVRVQRRGRG